MFFKKKNNDCAEKLYSEMTEERALFCDSEEVATVFVGSNEEEDRTCFLWETKEREFVVRLTDVMNPEKIFIIKVDDSVVIGHSASQADVCIDYDRAISRRHCRLLRRGNEYFLQDLASSNGTFVNGSRIYGDEQMLYAGDLIRIGRVQLKFETEH